MLKRAVLAVLAALAIATVPVPVLAQVATSALEVIVTDQTGQSLPGVTIVATRVDTGFRQESVTDTAGLATLRALPPGTYTVELTLTGFAPVQQEHLTLRVGQTGRLTVQMQAQLSETVTVTAEQPVVDLYKTDSSTNIVPEQIESLPVPDRDFQRLAFLAPGVQRERGGYRFIGGGPVIGAGGNASQSTILVDGVDFTDPTLGLARARFSQDAISEFRVIANRFDSEIGGSAGGALSIVTKSGTNAVRGSAFGFFRDKALRAKPTFDLKKNDYARQQVGGTIGGPLAKDKTHLFASFEQVNEGAVTLFRPGGAYASLAADPKVPVQQSLLFAGLDHRAGANQNIRAKFVYEHYNQENFRVGGVSDVSAGMKLTRDNYNAALTHAWSLSNRSLNQFSFSLGRRKFVEPNNSTSMAEYFSSGNTLITGAGITGDQADTGDIVEVRDTWFAHIGTGRWAADLKTGGAWQWVRDNWNFPVYPQGLMIYVTDTRALPLVYVNVSGSGESTIRTNILSGFAQLDLKPTGRVSLNLGVRYDLDTNGNNPSFTSPMMSAARGRDTNNIQPRAGLSWDLTGKGDHVIRGGAGLFTGRFLLVPSASELQQNGFTGRISQQRINGLLLGLPTFALDPANPKTTGLALARDAVRLDGSFVIPQSTQVTGGYTVRLGRTGLFADVEGIYVKGTKEILVRDTNFKGNATGGRINPAWNQINTYTNEGYSRYAAFVTSVNGTIAGGHVVTAALTLASKKNVEDDFSPALTDYPNDPVNIAAEYGRSRADERVRFVTSAVLKLPARVTLAPIFEYGSGQPWNKRLGYDYNGDGKNSDRPAGEPRFNQDGPTYASLNLRATYRLRLGDRASADLIAEAFNLFNRINNDVNAIVNGMYLSGPTLANPALPAATNPRFGQFTSTLPPFEAQLGVRIVF